MDKLNFKWIEQKGQYQNGEDLFLNRIQLGSVSWNCGISKTDTDAEKKRYIGSTRLYVNKSWSGATAKEVKEVIEQKVTTWFDEALKPEPNRQTD